MTAKNIGSDLKKQILFLFILLSGNLAMCQIADGTVAPNFEVTDVNGQTHELYAYLADGYSVVVCFMATWSDPCWAYHNGAYNGSDGQGALIELYETHSVDNGGEVIILMIEGDPNTNIECLVGGPGCNYTTYGDWTQDTPYPVIESDEVASQFEISEFPTIMTICPNGPVTETGRLTAENHWTFIETNICPELMANDAALYYPYESAITCESEELIIDLVNLGSDTLTSAHIISTGGLPEIDLQWTGSLATFQSESINLGVITPNAGQEVIVSIDGEDDNPQNDTIYAGFVATVSSSHIRLELQSDTYPEDFSFQIRDENNNVVVSDGNWGSLGADALIIRDYFLPEMGCYQVWLLDSYGDGLFEEAYCYAFGVNSIGDEMELILDVQPGEFSEVLGGANINEIVVSIDEHEAVFTTIEIYPNPTSDSVNLVFELASPGATKMQLTSPKGDIVFSKALGNLGTGRHNLKVDVSGVAAGYYLLSLTCDGAMMSSRIKVK